MELSLVENRRQWNLLLLGSVTLLGAALLLYWNALSGSFIFDDLRNIVDAPSTRRLWSLSTQRPVSQFTFSLNYALSGLNPWAFRLTNVFIHAAAAIALFLLLRRVLLTDRMRERFCRHATLLSFLVALIWMAHPLQTESVTYIVQRCESLMGLFYLLAFYFAARAWTSPHRNAWSAACVAATLLAIGSKEVAITIPPMLLLFDRTFFAGTFRQAIKRSWPLYGAFALAFCAGLFWMLTHLHGAVSAVQAADASPWEYLRSQAGVLLRYLRLVFWPSPLVLDYRWRVAMAPGQFIPQGIIILALLGATVWAVVRRPAIGFAGAWFFGILAVTSSFLPLLDLYFEHRMYLPLAAVVSLCVIGGYALIVWSVPARRQRMGQWAGLALILAACCALAVITVQRNRDYRSAMVMWQDVLSKQPENDRALVAVADELMERGEHAKALQYYAQALKLNRGSWQVPNSAGEALSEMGRDAEAIPLLQQAARLRPDQPAPLINLGISYFRLGDRDKAIESLRRAVEIAPENADALNNLGMMLLAEGYGSEAVDLLRRATSLLPDKAVYWKNLGLALRSEGNYGKAADAFQRAMSEEPEWAEPAVSLAWLLAAAPDDNVRNGVEAMKIARALIAREGQTGPLLDLLAAAAAEAGDFAEAQPVAQRALVEFERAGKTVEAAAIQTRLKEYEAGRPWRIR